MTRVLSGVPRRSLGPQQPGRFSGLPTQHDQPWWHRHHSSGFSESSEVTSLCAFQGRAMGEVELKAIPQDGQFLLAG